MDIYCLFFNDYETLDLMGPIEFLHRIPDAHMHYVSLSGGLIPSHQGFYTDTQKLECLSENSILLIPGGQGTRGLVHDKEFIGRLAQWADQAGYCLAVCTGSALLATTGKLNGLRATSNKKAFEWVRSVNAAVDWQPVARWVRSGTFYTSSGVSAGMDMALGFIADQYGAPLAHEIATHTEYLWQNRPERDDFARLVAD